MKLLRSVCVGIPGELYRWLDAAKLLKKTDAFIVPGTGLLTDAYDFRSWGPYGLFKWSLIAKLRGCKLMFISVGAGPIRSRWGRWLTKATLALADFRSYRDVETKDYLKALGAAVAQDKVYPDLAFNLPDQPMPHHAIRTTGRRVIGLGLMLYHGKLSNDTRREATYVTYLEELSLFVKWLWDEGYDVRLLIGEVSDRAVVAEFKTLLRSRYGALCDLDRLIDEPVLNVEDLWTQLAQTDAVIATRFHNVLLALMLNKPTISISFHQKCSALMKSMGLEDYCQDIRHLSGLRLIEQFRLLEDNGSELRAAIARRVASCREALDEQYTLIFNDISGTTDVNEAKRRSAVAARM
jgi:polysaccharide pyruvyl transferase WcaK-like protein